MPVSEAKEDMEVEPDHVYVIPPNQNMAISDGTLKLTPRTQTPGHAMPIDHFFRSVAEDQGSTAIGVILSGTGSDGTLGLAAWNWSANPRLVAPSFSNRTRSESYVGQCPLCTPATQKASPRRILAKPDFLAFLRILKFCVPIPDTWRPEPELPAIRRV